MLWMAVTKCVVKNKRVTHTLLQDKALQIYKRAPYNYPSATGLLLRTKNSAFISKVRIELVIFYTLLLVS